ncbi:unnamed protein product [Caenorhabditis auriculariae]|uniref:Uncharacterized protein n=1 Tax=Caenorhabditis auriculariae TaxID=2777116 RepID=A0A8S1GYP6_9PELO|nr:unnamed protein product [Caenorhabditis auriculariae]
MTQPASDTSDLQRFDQMFVHLTPRGASIPYNVCYDHDGHIWVASKGGLFKIHGTKKTMMWERKNIFSKKMSPFPQVCLHKDTIVYTCAEHAENVTELRMFTLDGELKHESFIDGIVISLTISEDGEMYITKQPTSSKTSIYKCSFDAPIGWEELLTSDEYAFFSPSAASTKTRSSPPCLSIPSRCIQNKRCEGDIFFPRTIRKYEDGILLMDKAGRFLKFDLEGNFQGLLAEIDAYLGNGFCVKDGKALMALSGIVYNSEGQTLCDDWLEFIALDGSSWKQQRKSEAASS